MYDFLLKLFASLRAQWTIPSRGGRRSSRVRHLEAAEWWEAGEPLTPASQDSAPCPRLSPLSDFFLHRQLLLEALWRVRDCFRGVLLDLGCNDKPYEVFFSDQCSAWVGLDRLFYAGSRTKANVGGDARHLPFRQGAFDTVLCTQVLSDVPEPLELFSESHRVLRPGGYLVLSASQYNPAQNEPHDYFRFSRHALRYLAERVGFEVVALFPQGGAGALVGFVLSNHFPFNGRNALSRWLSAFLQLLFLKLDRWRFRPTNTIGWVIACRKQVKQCL